MLPWLFENGEISYIHVQKISGMVIVRVTEYDSDHFNNKLIQCSTMEALMPEEYAPIREMVHHKIKVTSLHLFSLTFSSNQTTAPKPCQPDVTEPTLSSL